jgi:ribosomal protein S18 acetylase RimI-like enzyme
VISRYVFDLTVVTRPGVVPMIRHVLNGPNDDAALNELFAAAWPNHAPIDVGALLEESLFQVMSYDSDALVGFVRVVSCGSHRGFLLGPTVHPDWQGRGIGKALLNEAAAAAEGSGLDSLHVEFMSNQRSFYASAGFRHTAAGVRKLTPTRAG